MKLIHKLQNSPFTSWMWRFYINENTHEIRIFPIWKTVGMPWRKWR